MCGDVGAILPVASPLTFAESGVNDGTDMTSELPRGVTFAPLGQSGMRCYLTSPSGLHIELRGSLEDIEPALQGDPPLTTNRALVQNLWAFAKHEKQFRRLRNEESRRGHRRSADAHVDTAVKIAALVDLRGSETRAGWCSACFAQTDHNRLRTDFGTVRAYLCDGCGSPTLGCAAASCPHMATRGFGPIRLPRFCAQHRHDIPGFEKASDTIRTLADYESLLAFESRNMARGSRLALTSVLAAGAVGTGAVLAAPAIGGAVGTLVGGYTGAAASSYGLAMLGGGSLAAGGLGMAGGTAVIAVAGAAMGGALGSSVTSAYISEDKSFKIEKIQEGSGVPVLVANGFLTEGTDTSNEWRTLVLASYPNAAIYRVHWGSKELAALGLVLGIGVGRRAAGVTAKNLAARATRAGAKKLGPLTAAMLAADVAKNPWHTAKVRADRTGVALAGLLARTEEPAFVLVGHSLGGRVMVSAAEALALKGGAVKIESVHLLGAAVGMKRDWHPLERAVTGTVSNYFSTRDNVLRYAYTVVQPGSTAIGLRGIKSRLPRIKDRDVTKLVSNHSEYIGVVRLAG